MAYSKTLLLNPVNQVELMLRMSPVAPEEALGERAGCVSVEMPKVHASAAQASPYPIIVILVASVSRPEDRQRHIQKVLYSSL